MRNVNMNTWSVCFVGVILLPTICGIMVNTPVGNVIGVEKTLDIDGTPRRISVFNGIPYAESTAGANRFMKPIPKAPFSSPFNVTEYPIGCRQGSEAMETATSSYVTYTEDCLILTIYVPHTFANRAIKLPVLVWFYGGGFFLGSVADYNADYLSAFGNVVVVTVNYRIGPFGFMRSADGQLIGNQGLWDQHLALRWVHDNIAAFTGNPAEVAIFGQSAGAASVSYQALYPGNRGLFQRVIAQSGTALSSWGYSEKPDISDFLTKTGCGMDIPCLQALPAEKLMFDISDVKALVHYRPTVDNDFLIDTPYNIMFGKDSKSESARNFFASLDIIQGVASDEAAMFLPVFQQMLNTTDFDNFTLTQTQFTEQAIPYFQDFFMYLDPVKDAKTIRVLTNLFAFEYSNWTDPDNLDSPRQAAIQIITDHGFFFPLVQTVAAHVALTHQPHATYVYEFAIKPC